MKPHGRTFEQRRVEAAIHEALRSIVRDCGHPDVLRLLLEDLPSLREAGWPIPEDAKVGDQFWFEADELRLRVVID